MADYFFIFSMWSFAGPANMQAFFLHALRLFCPFRTGLCKSIFHLYFVNFACHCNQVCLLHGFSLKRSIIYWVQGFDITCVMKVTYYLHVLKKEELLFSNSLDDTLTPAEWTVSDSHSLHSIKWSVMLSQWCPFCLSKSTWMWQFKTSRFCSFYPQLIFEFKISKGFVSVSMLCLLFSLCCCWGCKMIT